MVTASSQQANSVPDALRGIIAPMYTPVHADGTLDELGTREMVEWLADCGCVRTVFARSGMGKMFTFTVAETQQFVTWVSEALRGRMGLIVGAGGEWLNRDTGGKADFDAYVSQAIDLTTFAQNAGAAAAVHVLPAALEPRSGETHADLIYRYYEIIHEATELPIVLYQPAGLPEDYCLTVPLMERLLELPRVVGLKLSTVDDSVFQPIAATVARRSFALICGHEGYYAKGLRTGAVGVIGQGCNAYPEILAVAQYRHEQGDSAGADRAMDDVWNALGVTDGLDSSVALKQYIAGHGYRIQPFDRSGTPPYAQEVISRITEQLDALRRVYRKELGLPTLSRLAK